MSKQVICFACNGSGQIPEYDCGKTTYHTCQNCGGSGYTYEPDEDEIKQQQEDERRWGKRIFRRIP